MLHVWKDLREHAHAMREHQRELHEIDEMDDRTLEELGISRDELRRIVETPDTVSERMIEMARRHGIGAAEIDLDRAEYAHLLKVCAHCHNSGLCARYLADESLRADQAAFCPNHDEYLALRAS